MKSRRYFLPLTLLLIAASFCLQARTFRQFQEIARPDSQAQLEPPPGYEQVEEVDPVEPDQVREAVGELVAAWNDGSAELDGMLSPDFYDRQRLLNSRVDVDKVPFDAEVNVLGISNIQTLNQFKSVSASGNEQRLSYVSADVRTQILFDSPSDGFQRIEGTNQYLLEITQETTY